MCKKMFNLAECSNSATSMTKNTHDMTHLTDRQFNYLLKQSFYLIYCKNNRTYTLQWFYEVEGKDTWLFFEYWNTQKKIKYDITSFNEDYPQRFTKSQIEILTNIYLMAVNTKKTKTARLIVENITK